MTDSPMLTTSLFNDLNRHASTGVIILLVTIHMRKNACFNYHISYRPKTIVRYPKIHCFLTEAVGNVRGVRDGLRRDLSEQHLSTDQH